MHSMTSTVHFISSCFVSLFSLVLFTLLCFCFSVLTLFCLFLVCCFHLVLYCPIPNSDSTSTLLHFDDLMDSIGQEHLCTSCLSPSSIQILCSQGHLWLQIFLTGIQNLPQWVPSSPPGTMNFLPISLQHPDPLQTRITGGYWWKVSNLP